ncbi:hypothetical protein DFH09DRAFT_843039, partial [Mycena vulgaris]
SKIQVNCFSTALLTLLLLSVMVRTVPEHATTSRIVFVWSAFYYWVDLKKRIAENPGILQTLGGGVWGASRYAQNSRYRPQLISPEYLLRARPYLPPATPLVFTVVSPGYCHSELRPDFFDLIDFIDWLSEPMLARTAEEGSRHLVWVTVAHEEHLEALSGEYIECTKVQETSDYVLTVEDARAENRLWDETVEILS